MPTGGDKMHVAPCCASFSTKSLSEQVCRGKMVWLVTRVTY